MAALSGGSNRATSLSLNACPYRATVILHRRPRVLGSMEATTILTQGAAQNCEIEQLEGGRMKRQPKRPIDVSSDARFGTPNRIANLNLAVKTP